jgi:hypothetical protein
MRTSSASSTKASPGSSSVTRTTSKAKQSAPAVPLCAAPRSWLRRRELVIRDIRRDDIYLLRYQAVRDSLASNVAELL